MDIEEKEKEITVSGTSGQIFSPGETSMREYVADKLKTADYENLEIMYGFALGLFG